MKNPTTYKFEKLSGDNIVKAPGHENWLGDEHGMTARGRKKETTADFPEDLSPERRQYVEGRLASYVGGVEKSAHESLPEVQAAKGMAEAEKNQLGELHEGINDVLIDETREIEKEKFIAEIDKVIENMEENLPHYREIAQATYRRVRSGSIGETEVGEILSEMQAVLNREAKARAKELSAQVSQVSGDVKKLQKYLMAGSHLLEEKAQFIEDLKARRAELDAARHGYAPIMREIRTILDKLQVEATSKSLAQLETVLESLAGEGLEA